MKVFAGAENIISSLGFSAEENSQGIIAGNSGIVIDDSGVFSPLKVPLSLVDHERIDETFSKHVKLGGSKYTPLEKMFLLSISDSLKQTNIDISSADTLIIITTTKGNINLLETAHMEEFGRERIYLHEMGRVINEYFGNPNKPLIVSNACISGVLGIVYAERLIRAGKYKNIIVSGGDLMSEFIVSGFQSFQSLSEKSCKPFDSERDGLTLGEGCGTIVLSADMDPFLTLPVEVLGGAGSNDANHISGPSRTGEGLYLAIQHAMELSEVRSVDIDYVSAHGTATDYNDEMEAKAFSRCGLENTPVNSYKGYIGHTLGAAGLIEAAFCLQSMRKDMLFRSAGYDNNGLSKALNILNENKSAEVNTCLKTASGFGGSNAAVILKKVKK